MPLGAALGALTHDGRLHLALRYRHAEFDRAAAHEFVAIYLAVLLSIATATTTAASRPGPGPGPGTAL
jgi:hypothetical protein